MAIAFLAGLYSTSSREQEAIDLWLKAAAIEEKNATPEILPHLMATYDNLSGGGEMPWESRGARHGNGRIQRSCRVSAAHPSMRVKSWEKNGGNRFVCAMISLVLLSASHASARASAKVEPDAVTCSIAAKAAYDAGKYSEAERQYTRALAMTAETDYVSRVVVLTNLGACQRERRSYENAAATLESAITLGSMHLDEVPAIVRANVYRQYAALLRKRHVFSIAEGLEIAAESISPTSGTAAVVSEPASAAEPNATGDARASNTVAVNIGAIPSYPTVKPMIQAEVREVKPLNEECRKNAAAVSMVMGTDIIRGSKMRLYHQWKYGRDLDGKPLDERTRRQLVLQHITEKEINDHAVAPQRSTWVAHAGMRPSPTELSHRWARDRMPLRVYIPQSVDDTSMAQGKSVGVVDGSYSTLLKLAFDEWAQASGGMLTFNFVSRESEADLYCMWTKEQPELNAGDDDAIGVTHYQCRSNSHGNGIDVKLLVVEYKTDTPIRKERFYEVCLHELGHAFGLEHSSYQSDVMYPYIHAEPMTSLSANDRERLVNLYWYKN